MQNMKPFCPIVLEELDTQDCIYNMTDGRPDNLKPIYPYLNFSQGGNNYQAMEVVVVQW